MRRRHGVGGVTAPGESRRSAGDVFAIAAAPCTIAAARRT